MDDNEVKDNAAKDKSSLERKVDEYMIRNFGTCAEMPEIYSNALNNVFLILKVYEDGFMLSEKRQKDVAVLVIESHRLLLGLMRLNNAMKLWDLHVSKAILDKSEASIDKAGIQKDADAFKALGKSIDGLIIKTSSLVDDLELDYRGL